MLELVAAHADCWEVNLPPVAAKVQQAATLLEAACRRRGRDPGAIQRSQWIFTRVDPGATADARAEFRCWNPWFREISDREIGSAVAFGSAAACRTRIAELAAELSLDLPVIDLSGLSSGPARAALEALAPANTEVDAGT
jgi:hypothetical protein